MKRVIAVITLFVCLFILTGCGTPDPIVDTWEIKGVIYQGEYVEMDNFTFVFNDDNTGHVSNDEETNTFTWEYGETEEEKGLRLYSIFMEGGNTLVAGIGPDSGDEVGEYSLLMVYYSDDLIMGFNRAE